jgi:phage terminase small subunit
MPIYDVTKDDRMLLFVQNVVNGMNPTAAARAAGYSQYERHAKRLMAKPFVKKMLAFAAEVSAKKKRITRDKVHEMVMEAFDIARTSADASSMVRAASELNRMNGFYEPERHVIELSSNVKEAQEALSQMSDDELLQLVDPKTIEGEAERVDD